MAAALTACSVGGDKKDGQAGETPDRNETTGLPPSDFEGLEPLFSARLEELGVRLTRARLVDVRTRKPDSNGRHLALYVEPTTHWPNSRYVENIAPLTKVFTPLIFDRWPALASFDVCQEPPPGVDDRRDPPPATAVDMMRRAAYVLEGGPGDLLALMLAAYRDPGAIRVGVSDQVGAEPAFQSVLQEVTRTVPLPTNIPTTIPTGGPYSTPTSG